MARITWRMLFPLAVALVLPICARSQTATYHLHNEISPELGGAFLTLKTIGPDRTSIARASANLKNQPVGQYLIESWRTVPGVPNVNGTIPAGSTFTVTLWMEKSSNFGTMFPVVEIYLLPSTGPRTLICSVTGSTALSTSLVTYTFFPTTTTPVSMTASDRFQLEVSVNVTQAPGNHNSQAEVDIEGTLNGQYDSRIIAPLPVPPSISNVSPTSGAAGASVTVSGSNFGATQGSSTVTFNGTAATPTSWGDMTIIAPVPSVATTGPVEVTVSGSVSNGVNFTVITAGTLSGMVTRASDGSALAGVLVEALQAGVVKGSTTTAANGSYSLSNLTAGTYDVRASATGYATKTVTGQTVVAGATATVDVSLVPQPVINNISPAAGPEGASVTISGSNFGSTQGSSTVTFNGVAATPTSWGATTIIAPAPAGATTGPVVVTVLGTDSNGLTFTVLPVGGIAGTVTRASDASPINGALVEALQSGVVKESTTTGAPGSYSMSSIVAGSYDVRISAAGYLSKLSIGVLVGGATTTVNAALVKPGTLSGKITQTDGTTPIAGAAVEASQGTAIAGTTTTNAGGDYSVGGLSPGNFTVQASAIGYNPQLQTGVSITEDANTTLNLSLAAAPPSAGVSYVYDQLGRLIAVIDPTGDTAVYHYDAVGNLLSISRQISSQVSIIEFTPDSGVIGDSVTIYGTGFSQTPSENTVTFNGVAATVTSANATQLVTSVPAGATTGPIAVSTPAGSAQSGAPFTVNTSSGAPTITGFNPTIGTPGTAVTITGTNFESVALENKVRFNTALATITSAAPTSILTSVPAAATSGYISVGTPLGKGVSAGDFFVPPPPYAVGDIEVATRMAYGETKAITIGSANKIALVLFDGTEGERVSLNITGVTIFDSYIYINKPDGTVLSWTRIENANAGFIDTQTLPKTGTYTIFIDPTGTYTGNMTLALYRIVDAAGSITPGGPPMSLTIAYPGQNASFLFSGTAGQRVSLNITGVTIGDSYTYIKLPDGSTLASTRIDNSSSGFIDVQTLPVSGTYTIFVDPQKAFIGHMTLALYDVVDISGTIEAGGSPVVVSVATPGQNASLTFSGASGQQVTVRITNNSIAQSTVSLLNPDSSLLASCVFCSGTFNLATQTLPTTGTYTITINPRFAFIGNMTVTVTSP